ncbi:hypothetical protein MNV49_007971 [Pseudohyphozyma bogoriensis]|nr:hypothetical protein MNV49_007971 [Pseudohyphozyma bogoriensis]
MVTEVKIDPTKAESDNEPIAVYFGKDDPENPQDGWSSVKKWRETFGRRRMLIALTALITVLFLPQALAPNFASILATRFFQGAAGSVEGPVIAGVVADLFAKKNRGRAMATFVTFVYFGNGCGPVLGNWIAFRMSWRWVFWLQMIMSGVACLLVTLFLPETRGEVLLQKRAIKHEKETGRPHYIPGGMHARSWSEAFKKSSTRPLVFLFIGAVPHVFTEVYGFNQGQSSTVMICMPIGALVGLAWDQLVQERWYQRSRKEGGGIAKPESRLYSSAIGGVLYSVGGFGFAWTARAGIPWIAPCIFVTIFNIGTYTIYLATYQYDKLTYPWASSLIGFVAAGFAVVPFVMIKYGPQLRARSKVAVHLAAQESQPLGDTPEEGTVDV